jgi:spore coat protein CotH
MILAMTSRPASRYVPAILALVVLTVYRSSATAQETNSESTKPIDKAPAPTAAEFYRSDEMQSVHLQVADEDWQRMLAALPERIYVPASFRWREISFKNVAIRFKGNSSSSPAQQHKRSFLVKFDEFENGQQFLGLKRASFDNGVQFGSVFSEPIITEILRDLKIPTHRCNYAKLFLNGKYHGVYVNVERIDKTFVENHLPDPDGLLFKVDQGGPGANLQFVGDDSSPYEHTFEPDTKGSKKKLARLVEFIRFINQAPDRDFAARLEENLELNDFLGVTAVLLFSGAFDQLTGWNPHNYYLYYDGTQHRWRYLPWDLDVGFCESAFGQIRVLADWNAAWPAAGQLPNPLLDRIVANPELLKRYRTQARAILDKYFEPERLCAVIDAKYTLLKADLLADPFPHHRITNPGERNYDDVVGSMKKFVRQRYALAQKQLDDPGERPKQSRPPGGGPTPELMGKIQRIQQAVQKMQQKGEDISPIIKIMEQVGPLLQNGKFAEAGNLVDQALKLVDENSHGPAK